MNCIKSLCKVFNNIVVHQNYFSVVGPVLASSRIEYEPFFLLTLLNQSEALCLHIKVNKEVKSQDKQSSYPC